MKKIFTCGLSLLALVGLAACSNNQNGPENTTRPSSTQEGDWYVNNALETATNLNIAINDSGNFFISNHNPQSFIGLDGRTYASGDLLPSWRYMQTRLNINMTDTASGSTRNENFNSHATANFVNADLINGTVTNINQAGANGQILNLLDYVNVENPGDSLLPNISKFLQLNPTLANSMQIDGQLFFSPYFDAFAEPEHYFIMNVDMVKNILDSADGAGSAAPAGQMTYHPYNNYTSNSRVSITRTDSDGISEASIITKQNAGRNAYTAISSSSTGAEMISNLKAHLNTVYAGMIGQGQIYENLSDIFISESASYDTDELVSLMYCIRSNNALAQGVEVSTNPINIMIVRRQENNSPNQRAVNLIQGLGIMYGVRGALESKCNAAIYMDKDGVIQDGRTSEEFIDMFDYSSELYNDQIIATNYESLNGISYVKSDQAFLIYDFLNNSTNSGNTTRADGTQVQMQAVLPPVNYWDDGDATTDYFHFSESTRAVRTEAWCIPSRVANDQNKLTAALTLMDYLYSIEGDMLMNYGPNAEQIASYGGTNLNAYCSNETVSSLSQLRQANITHPIMSETALNAMNVTGDSNTSVSPYTGQGWNRWSKAEMGSNLPIGFVREFFAEYETMTETGKTGYDRVISAIETGSYRTLSFSASSNFLTAVPGLTLTGSAATAGNNLIAVTDMFSADSTKTTSIAYVKFGWGSGTDTITKDAYRALLDSNMNGDTGLVQLYRDAYASIQ